MKTLLIKITNTETKTIQGRFGSFPVLIVHYVLHSGFDNPLAQTKTHIVSKSSKFYKNNVFLLTRGVREVNTRGREWINIKEIKE